MDKKKQQLIILSILTLVLGGALVNAFMPKKRSKPAIAVSTEPVLLTPVASVPSTAPRFDAAGAKASNEESIEQQGVADKPWGADPFFHVVSNEVFEGSSLVLKGVSIGAGRRKYATINNEIVTVGDTVFGYRVEAIDQTKVLLKRGTESYYLVWSE